MTDAAADPARLVERLRQTALDLVVLVGGEAPARLGRRPDADEWSAAEIVAHLADAEMVYAARIRTVVTADRPWLAAFDEEAWAARIREVETDAKESLARWRSQRDATVRLLADLRPEEWERAGMHAERGEVTVGDLAAALADHDRAHLAQLRRALTG